MSNYYHAAPQQEKEEVKLSGLRNSYWAPRRPETSPDVIWWNPPNYYANKARTSSWQSSFYPRGNQEQWGSILFRDNSK